MKNLTVNFPTIDIRHKKVGETPTNACALLVHGAAVSLSWSRCHYGGLRPWLVCPECRARRVSLYLCPYGFRCRTCLALAYPVENETARQRAIRRALKQISMAALDPARPGFKPRWLRWPTHRTRQAQAEDAETMLARLPDRRERLQKAIRKADKALPRGKRGKS
jgi:hypothetical protein